MRSLTASLLIGIVALGFIAVGTAAVQQPAAPTEIIFAQTQSLYRDGRYEDVVDRSEQRLEVAPNDYRQRVLMSAALLRLHQREAAVDQAKALEQASDSKARQYGTAVKTLLSAYDAREGKREKLMDELKHFRANEASTILAGMNLPPLPDTILKSSLLAYQSRFGEAQALLDGLAVRKFSDRRKLDELRKDLKKRETLFLASLAKLDSMYYGGDAVSTWCDLVGKDGAPSPNRNFVADYLSAAETAAQLCPLAPRVMDFTFHVALLGLEYQQFEKLADDLLRAKGSLALPAYSRDRYLYLVIDKEHARLRTEPDNAHAFNVRVSYRFVFPLNWQPTQDRTDNPDFGKAEPFDLPFGSITSLEQKTDGNTERGVGSYINAGAYALKLEPHGLVPVWAFMNIVHYLYGAAVQKQQTANLGRYILHVTENPRISSKLADPLKKSSQLGSVLGIVAMSAVSAVGARYGSAELQQQGLEGIRQISASMASQAAAESHAAQQHRAWYQELAAQTASFGDSDVFDEIDKLLEVAS